MDIKVTLDVLSKDTVLEFFSSFELGHCDPLFIFSSKLLLSRRCLVTKHGGTNGGNFTSGTGSWLSCFTFNICFCSSRIYKLRIDDAVVNSNWRPGGLRLVLVLLFGTLRILRTIEVGGHGEHVLWRSITPRSITVLYFGSYRSFGMLMSMLFDLTRSWFFGIRRDANRLTSCL